MLHEDEDLYKNISLNQIQLQKFNLWRTLWYSKIGWTFLHYSTSIIFALLQKIWNTDRKRRMLFKDLIFLAQYSTYLEIMLYELTYIWNIFNMISWLCHYIQRPNFLTLQRPTKPKQLTPFLSWICSNFSAIKVYRCSQILSRLAQNPWFAIK